MKDFIVKNVSDTPEDKLCVCVRARARVASHQIRSTQTFLCFAIASHRMVSSCFCGSDDIFQSTTLCKLYCTIVRVWLGVM